MCGINGFINNSTLDPKELLILMNKALRHRGPDRQDFWVDEQNRIGLAHTRLAILDLSESGNQPMLSRSGRFIMVFNGEIYNYKSIKEELENRKRINWRGASDTEILLEAIEQWGVKPTLVKCIGMFSIALFDKKQNILVLARDRMGEKPLYYGWIKSNFVFSSEISAIASLPEFENQISKNSLGLYLQYSSIPEPYSIYENIYKLSQGGILEYNLKTNKYLVDKYWSIDDELTKVTYSSDIEVVSTLNDLLVSSIGLQMEADVPTGAFLSGGIDSSTVAAIMQSLSSKKVDTFSIGFHDEAFNEANFAKKVANYIGSNHHELYVSDEELLSVVPNLSSIYSEPFSEASQIPTYLVSKLAKQSVTVALSGDAGDELFCGYWRYHFANKLWSKIKGFALPLRQTISSSLSSMPHGAWKFLLTPLSFRKGAYGEVLNYPDKILKFLPLLAVETKEELYHRGIIVHNREVEGLIYGFKEPETEFNHPPTDFSSFYEMMMYYDLKTYLPNNNLTKVDRAAMAVSLETRVPLLDHRIVSFALSLPMQYKLRQGEDKWVLKQVLYKYVPEDLFKRPKKGFAVPLSSWLRGPLKDWARELLDERSLKEQGFFDPAQVQRYWDEHQSGKRNWSVHLWDIILFQDWLKKQKEYI